MVDTAPKPLRSFGQETILRSTYQGDEPTRGLPQLGKLQLHSLATGQNLKRFNDSSV